jgi:formylglycine-generating enzyme required for sulfatase activity/class 3 adenylate cyclase
MPQLPSGTVTFLFTDIERSTSLWEQFPEVMAVAIALHERLIREAIEQCDGVVFKSVGDAVYGAFSTPASALAAAVGAQRAIQAEDWPGLAAGFPPLRVRMGVHSGSPLQRNGDYLGPALNRTARLTHAGHGGQVLLSLATEQMVRDHLPADVRLWDRGEHRLRDLRSSEHIFQVVVPDLPTVRTALRTVKALESADRVVVATEPAAPPTGRSAHPAAGAATALLDALRSDSGEVRLSLQDAIQLARRPPADLTEYRLGRVAEWSQPQYWLDRRFVQLTLLIDQGLEATGARWLADERRFDDLGDVLAAVSQPGLVLLGPPGSGKSTLLRRLDRDTAIAALRGEQGTLACFFQLNHYWHPAPGQLLQAPIAWLNERWRARYPALPALDQLLEGGRVLLLLDGLNEMPHTDAADYHARITAWKRFLHDTIEAIPGNRAVFSCRSLDYSLPLSTTGMPVAQIRLEPMSDAQVRQFLELYSPAWAAEIWRELEHSPDLDLVRAPFYLALLVDTVEAEGRLPGGRAALLTGFVWQALRREIERDTALFRPGTLLTERDHRQLVQSPVRPRSHVLPEHGSLIPLLGSLARGMQQQSPGNESSQVRVPFGLATRILDSPEAKDVLRAGEALGVLQEDAHGGEVMFRHQLLQEYFAGRWLAGHPDPELARAAWAADEVQPSLGQTLAGLAPADPLPRLAGTRWDEATVMACAMSADPAELVRALLPANLPLAARCAIEAGVALPDPLIEELARLLLARSRDRAADLRARIEAALRLAELGDPRLERREGPHGTYLLPPLAVIDGGTYDVGHDSAAAAAPPHQVDIDACQIGLFPVTNAEWARFMAAGGYEDERWWDTAAARAWWRGEGTDEAPRDRERRWWRTFRANPGLFQEMYARGVVPQRVYDKWTPWLQLEEEALEAVLGKRYPGGRKTQPEYWRDPTFNHPGRPVVGVCWFECRAYCRWLAAQTGRPFRLPTEAEWEAAARGPEARSFPWGASFDSRRCNVADTHVRGTTPIGVFPDGDTPEGLTDMIGNSADWTSSLWGPDREHSAFPYPYRRDDGREDPTAPAAVCRVLRGSSWGQDGRTSHASARDVDRADIRGNNAGFRLAVSGPD